MATSVLLLRTLREFIYVACSEEEFRILLYDALNGYDYLKNQSGNEFPTRIHSSLLKLDEERGEVVIRAIAREALTRWSLRVNVEEPRKALAAALDPVPANAAAAAPGPVAPAPVPAAQLPPELVRALGLYEPGPQSVALFARDVRSQFRNNMPNVLDSPFRFHLSALERERLTAVLALERRPDPAYLWWLAERVTIEIPAIGFLSAKALTAAALRLARADLPRLRLAADTAVDRLTDMMNAEGGPAAAPPNGADPQRDDESADYDPAARKEELDAAIALVDMRSVRRKSYLPPDDLERFLAEVIGAFQRQALEQLCRAVEFPLTKFARPDDPLENCVVYLAIRARGGRWERDLIQATLTMQPANATFRALQQRYAAANVGV